MSFMFLVASERYFALLPLPGRPRLWSRVSGLVVIDGDKVVDMQVLFSIFELQFLASFSTIFK